MDVVLIAACHDSYSWRTTEQIARHFRHHVAQKVLQKCEVGPFQAKGRPTGVSGALVLVIVCKANTDLGRSQVLFISEKEACISVLAGQQSEFAYNKIIMLLRHYKRRRARRREELGLKGPAPRSILHLTS